MDLAQPISAVIPTLDGPVLQALTSTPVPVSGRRLWRMAGVGSEAGVRRCLNRLTEQGLVIATQAGQAWLYVGNRAHVAWPAVELLADLRSTFRTRLTEEVAGWSVPPVVAGVFGSAARRDGHPASDVDLLLVHPDGLERSSSEWGAWEQQVDDLRRAVRAWTGNTASPYDVDRARAVEIVAREDLGESWARDLDVVAGERRWQDILRDGWRARPSPTPIGPA